MVQFSTFSASPKSERRGHDVPAFCRVSPFGFSAPRAAAGTGRARAFTFARAALSPTGAARLREGRAEIRGGTGMWAAHHADGGLCAALRPPSDPRFPQELSSFSSFSSSVFFETFSFSSFSFVFMLLFFFSFIFLFFFFYSFPFLFWAGHVGRRMKRMVDGQAVAAILSAFPNNR